MQPSEAWAAGLFEGEGSIVKQSNGRWQLALSTTDYDVGMAFARVVGIGKFYGPYMPRNRRVDGSECKPYWKWIVSDGLGIRLFAELFMPYLSARRAAKLQEAVDEVTRLKLTRKPHTRRKRSDKLLWIAGELEFDN
jgi:hypothetical protein